MRKFQQDSDSSHKRCHGSTDQKNPPNDSPNEVDDIFLVASTSPKCRGHTANKQYDMYQTPKEKGNNSAEENENERVHC